MVEQTNSIPCIILAGGLGTRLQNAVNDVVKPMAPMGHKPFLHVLLDHLFDQGISHFVLALGHKSESVVSYFKHLKLPYHVEFAFEKEALGTGGALRNALGHVKSPSCLAMNGDTFFNVGIQQFIHDATTSNADFYMALKTASSPERYGNVLVKEDKIIDFNAPNHDSSLQNGGIYWIKKDAFLACSPNQVFSLENELFPKLITKQTICGKQYDGYFIDIGIPEDYFRARDKFSRFFIDESWTLFLDRDGVINERIVGDYVKNIEEFQFIPGALEAIARFSKLFGRLVVVTNQQGIGKGLMTERNLMDVHRYMCSEIEKHGGKIDAVYFAPQLAKENSQLRKPNIGMALLAQQDFPEINFQKAVMIGDSDSDILFGQSLGMITVKLNATEVSQTTPTLRRENLLACSNLFERKPL